MTNINLNILFVVLLGLVKCACAINGTGTIANKDTGNCLTIFTKGPGGAEVTISSCDGSQNQK